MSPEAFAILGPGQREMACWLGVAPPTHAAKAYIRRVSKPDRSFMDILSYHNLPPEAATLVDLQLGRMTDMLLAQRIRDDIESLWHWSMAA